MGILGGTQFGHNPDVRKPDQHQAFRPRLCLLPWLPVAVEAEATFDTATIDLAPATCPAETISDSPFDVGLAPPAGRMVNLFA